MTPSISADGRYVAFSSFANNLVSGDTNGFDDAFVHDRGTVDNSSPLADFNALPLSGEVPLTVEMHNISTGNITSCFWDYGDGTTGTSCVEYHNHIYDTAGNFTISLTVSGPGGSDRKIRGNYINVSDPSNSADLSLELPIEVTSKASPYLPNHLTLETTVKNRSSSVSVSNVEVSFYDGNPDNGGQLIGNDSIEELGPGVSQSVSVSWPLNGNIANHRVYARVSTSSAITDPNSGNNTISRPISVYYINDFQHDEDMYSLENNKSKLKYTSEGLKDDVRNLLDSADLNQWLFGSLYFIIGKFAEGAGYCYGMTSTSILYYKLPILKPVPINTYDMTIDQSLGNIKRYQRWQLVDMIEQRLFSSFDADTAYRATRDSIIAGSPIIHGIYDSGKGGGHSVVAYKIVELDNENRVFYYDPNNPLYVLDGEQEQETYGTFRGDTYSYPSNFLRIPGYSINEVYPIHPTVSADNLVRIIPRLIAKFFEDLFQSNEGIVVTEFLPAEDGILASTNETSFTIIFRDSQGRRVGIEEGAVINEISGATIETFDSSQLFSLPRELVYTVEASNATTVNFSLYANFPIDEETVKSIEYSEVILPSEITATVSLGLLNPDIIMTVGDQEISPGINITTSVNDIRSPTIFLPLILR